MKLLRNQRTLFRGPDRVRRARELLLSLPAGTADFASEGRVLADGQPERVGLTMLRPVRVIFQPVEAAA